jgi:mono/diheme cytochrome c family protein
MPTIHSKMKIVQHHLPGFLAAFILLGVYSCQQAGKNSTGSELIPDMAHATSYEANVLNDYSFHTWDKESTFSRRQLSQPRKPVNNTIARGYTGAVAHDGTYASAEEAVLSTMGYAAAGHGGVNYTPSGRVPYYYPDTEEGRTLATQQIKYNPFPITQNGIARGQELYNIYCAICHGEKGDGGGYLVRDNGGKYPAQPANLIDSAFVNSSNGRYYHAIVYGKNAMGSHADKLSFEERWQVIHYIRSLQASAKKLKYDNEVNSLNTNYGVPEAIARQLMANRQKPAVETPPVDAGKVQVGETQTHGSGH